MSSSFRRSGAHRFTHHASLVVASACVVLALPLRAQRCDSVTSRTSLAEMSGKTIRSIRIETHEPDALPIVSNAFDRLHVRTRESTIQRQMLVAAGDTVDTLLVGESLRRLRHLRYIGYATVRGTACGAGPVDLLVVTRDLWSMKPTLQVRSTTQAFAFTDRNLLGTGREATVGMKWDETGASMTVGLRDPWFLSRALALDLAASGDGERGTWSANLQKHERSILDPWGVEGSVAGAVIPSSVAHTESVNGIPVAELRRITASAIGMRRAHVSYGSVVHLTGGFEYDRLAWEEPLDGPALRQREFLGAGLGVRRRSVAYDTVTWLLPHDALVDVPLSFESELFVSAGHDFASERAASHVDAWAGRMWLAGRSGLFVGDLWGSGYVESSGWTGATLRGAITYYGAARRGLWSARLGAERLFAPDADVLSLVTADVTARAFDRHVPPPAGLVSASLERDVHLVRLSRSWTLDAGAFAAGSYRDGTYTESGRTNGSVGVLGGGLRLTPGRLGRATARLDVGFPVAGSGPVSMRPFVAIGITPWLEQDRQRDRRRPR